MKNGAEQSVSRRAFVCNSLFGAAACLAAPAMDAATVLARLSQAAPHKIGAVSQHVGMFWEPAGGTDTVCRLCPRQCKIRAGERGFCGVRENVGGKYSSMVYGYPAVVRSDPMEKGPFFHYLPATTSIALGTAGCNLDCKYCQSWQFAQARPEQTDNKYLPPNSLVEQTKKLGVPSITFTFSEPIVCIEYVIDTAKAARSAGLKTLVHTAAYALPAPLRELCKYVDAVNVDLKGFSNDFYKQMTGGDMDSVLEGIRTIKGTGVWLELTTLVVPGYNDDPATFARMCQWIRVNLGPDVPLHVSRFFPQYKLRNVPPTPKETLTKLRRIAYEQGLHYVYLGNLGGDPGESSYCPACGIRLIERIGYKVVFDGLDLRSGRCRKCGLKIPGVWSA
jgi:pyruvate formate lyase activating enzyme